MLQTYKFVFRYHPDYKYQYLSFGILSNSYSRDLKRLLKKL